MEHLISRMMPYLAVWVFIVFVLFEFWIWMLVDSIRNKSTKGTEKAIWVGIIFFGGVLGAIVYFFTIKTNKFVNAVGFTLIAIVIPAVIHLSILTKNESKQNKGNLSSQLVLEKSNTELVNLIHKYSTKKEENKYILLNKIKKEEPKHKTANDIANIDEKNYSEHINSWVDKDGKVHFTNTVTEK